MMANQAYNDRMSEIDECQGRPYPDDREVDALQLSFQDFCDVAKVLFINLQETTTDEEEKFAAKALYTHLGVKNSKLKQITG